MNRCVVFDQTTADILAKAGAGVELHDTDVQPDKVIRMAIDAAGASAAVIPGGGDNALLMRFTRQARPGETARIAGTHIAAGGFLGLNDEVELDAEPAPPKKWWQRILD